MIISYLAQVTKSDPNKEIYLIRFYDKETNDDVVMPMEMANKIGISLEEYKAILVNKFNGKDIDTTDTILKTLLGHVVQFDNKKDCQQAVDWINSQLIAKEMEG
jgi:hypothetical protein